MKSRYLFYFNGVKIGTFTVDRILNMERNEVNWIRG